MKKKLLLIFTLFSFNALAQSVTIVPGGNLNDKPIEIKKNGRGIDHHSINGTIGLGTYVGNFAYLQTHTNHSLNFATNNSDAQMTLATNGRLGIGLQDPAERLDVNGRVRIRHTPVIGENLSATSGVWMSNSANSLSINDGAFFGMETDQKIGVFIGGAWRFGVNNTGAISTTSMAGTGYRPVLASPNGTLTAFSQPQVWSISGSAFEPMSIASSEFVKTLYYAYFSSGSGYMIAPVNLPTGVNVTEIVVYYKNSTTTDILVVLDGQVLANNNDEAFSVESVGQGYLGTVTGIQSASLNLSTTSSFRFINNANKAYFLRVKSDEWNSNKAIYGVKIIYTY